MKLLQPTHRRQSSQRRNLQGGSPTRRALTRRAFSFVELLIVVMLLGIMAGVAAPKYRTALEMTHLECIAKQLAADLRRARSEAQQVSATRSIVFNLADSSYSSTDMMMLDRPGEHLSVSLTSGGFAVQINAADFGGSPTAVFDLYGTPVQAGFITIVLNGRTAGVSLNETGLVKVTL